MAKKAETPNEPKPKPRSPARTQDGAAHDACRYCHAKVRPEYNYCAHCGMPVDPAHDRPLFVVEGLSNLFNVVFFESLMEQELNRASRYGHDLSVLVAEIDSLPELEAALGYEESTNLVRDVAGVISAVIREPDTLASTNRVTAMGMQRFLVLLPETNEEGAFRAAEKIRGRVENLAFNLGDGDGRITVSMGVASTGKDSSADANLIARATKALMVSRSRSANRVQVASS